MQKCGDLLDHINKVIALADELACLEVPPRNKDVAITLFESLSPSYEHLIIALEMMPLKELNIEHDNTFDAQNVREEGNES